jgi:hypothetical protein
MQFTKLFEYIFYFFKKNIISGIFTYMKNMDFVYQIMRSYSGKDLCLSLLSFFPYRGQLAEIQ